MEIRDLERQKQKIIESAKDSAEYCNNKTSVTLKNKITISSFEELRDDLGIIELFAEDLTTYKKFMDQKIAEKEDDENVYSQLQTGFGLKTEAKSPSNMTSREDSVIEIVINQFLFSSEWFKASARHETTLTSA